MLEYNYIPPDTIILKVSMSHCILTLIMLMDHFVLWLFLITARQ